MVYNLIVRSIFSILLILVYLISLNNIYIFTIFGVLIYLIIFYEVYKFFKNKLLIINIYLLISLFNFLLYVYFTNDLLLINLLVFTIIFFDTFSYFIGSIFGKNYLFINISPKKTFEGYVGGFLLTNICFLILSLVYQNDTLINFILINLLIIIAVLGDLIESYFKRINQLKDSSNFLPGHGGFFDRFDSFISTIILLNIYNFINL